MRASQAVRILMSAFLLFRKPVRVFAESVHFVRASIVVDSWTNLIHWEKNSFPWARQTLTGAQG